MLASAARSPRELCSRRSGVGVRARGPTLSVAGARCGSVGMCAARGGGPAASYRVAPLAMGGVLSSRTSGCRREPAPLKTVVWRRLIGVVSGLRPVQVGAHQGCARWRSARAARGVARRRVAMLRRSLWAASLPSCTFRWPARLRRSRPWSGGVLLARVGLMASAGR